MEKNYIVAIDLGSNNVVVAVGSKAPGGKVNIEEVVIRESAGVSAGEVKNVETASAAIRKALEEINEKLGIRVAEAYTGISGNHIRCAKHPYYVIVAGRDGEITADDVRRLNESMRNMQAPSGFTLMHIIPQHYIVNDDEEVMDPVGRFGKTLGSTFNLIIGEDTIIQRLEKALAKSEVAQKKLFINPLAMAEAVTFPDEKELGVAVVDIGAGTTDVCIYQEGIVRSVSVIPIGADAINKDIRSYGIMERYVEDLKVMYGCAVADMVDAEKLVKIPGRTPNDYKDISFRNLATIIESRMMDIIGYVMEEIKDSGYEGKLGAGIVLTGGAANLNEIKALFEMRTGLEVRIAKPEILVTPESKAKVDDPRMSVAVGILWQGLNSGGETKVEKPAAGNAPAGNTDPWQAPQTVYDQIVQNQKGGAKKPADDDTDMGWEDDVDVRRKPKKEKKAKPEKVKKPKRDYSDFDDDDVQEDADNNAPPKIGVFGKLRKAITKAIDLDVLDDDDTTNDVTRRK